MIQRLSIVFPLKAGRFRAYAAFRHDAQNPLSGERNHAAFIEASVLTGSAPAWFKSATPIGPLATFSAPDCWADHPHREGIVPIGDADAASDPVFGCGLSLTLRDVRVLRDRLLETSDWCGAAERYAAEHDS
jgi:2-polyprenyl-6-methoxyphenol hydroxylase-like FAD-dependent oxidoreductase